MKCMYIYMYICVCEYICIYVDTNIFGDGKKKNQKNKVRIRQLKKLNHKI